MLERYGEYIEGILINCCSFSEMKNTITVVYLI